MSLINKFRLVSFASMLVVLVGLVKSPHALALVQNPNPQAQISFTFDDGGASHINQAAPIMQQYGLTGTSYVVTSCVGIVSIPNKCEADPGISYMTWAQIQTLQNTYGWEIGSHSVSHPLLTKASASKLDKELANSKKALASHGINATSFATPYGDYNNKVIEAIAKYYTNHRPFHDKGYNTWPYNDYMLRVQQVQAGVSVETVKGYIDQAVANNTWLILVFHDIENQPSSALKGYQYSSTDLAEIASYAKNSNIKVTNVSKGIVKADTSDNIVTDPVTTSNNLGNGWTTDQPTAVKVDTTTKGSDPEPIKSVKVTANATKTVHVFSPTVNVNPTSKYVVKGYINLTKQNSEIGFYIDEYDASGNWISGQYKQTLNLAYIKDLSFAYSASSSMVAKARLQIIITNSSGTIVYIDNIRWFATTSGPVPPPTPTPTNLLSNGDFEQGMAGWSVDNASISLDSANNGSLPTPIHSVKLTNITDRSVQLFAPKISVTKSKMYTVSANVNVASLTSGGEIGFYIDEYDASGNWISGQYLYTVRSVGSQKISFSYNPSSVNVASSSLQVIVSKGVGTVVYLDNVSISTT